MEVELVQLEQKLQQLAAYCSRLREENHSLRQQVLAATQENSKLKHKIEATTSRVSAILAKIPEDAL